MSRNPPPYLVTSAYGSIKPVLSEITAAADQERHSFGFMPARAYETLAVEGKLIVATHCDDGSLVGYTMLGGTFPQARVFQTYVAPRYRGAGVGQRLVKEAIKRCEERTYLSIRADVAEDLEAANRFYRDLGFRTVSRKKGGRTTGRHIIVRVRELSTPSLLDLATFGNLTGPVPRIHISTRTESPLYLIDLNVFFDVTKRRVRSAHAGRVFSAAADNSVRVAIADEFIRELERNTNLGVPDPTLELAKKLPRLSSPPPQVQTRLQKELAPLIFPARAKSGSLTQQDRSDIAHLGTAIHEGAQGFVTSEKAILAQADHLRRHHRLDVLSPAAFGRDYAASAGTAETHQVRIQERDLWCKSLSSADTGGVIRLARAQEVPEPVIRCAVASGTSVSPRRRIAVGSGGAIIAFASWDAPKPAVVERRIYVFVDPTDAAVDLALEYVLTAAIHDSVGEVPSVLYLCPSAADAVLRLKAIDFGFRPRSGTSSRTGKLEKICFGAIFTEENWASRRSALEAATGITLPLDAPSFENSAEEIRIVSSDRMQLGISVGDLENLLSPALFASRGRESVIVPIKADYVEELFSGSLQRSLLHENRALLLREKCYFSHRRTHRIIPDGGLIVFYESGSQGGRSAAVALARIRRRYLASESVARRLTVERGVVGAGSLRQMADGKQVCVTEFDNVTLFSRVVPLLELKQMGCADGANLVTARALSTTALKNLLTEAYHDG